MSHVIDSPELLFSGACTCRSGSDHFTSNVHNTGATLAQTKFIEFLPLTEFFLTCFHSSRQASRTRCPLWRTRRPSTSGQGSVSSLSSARSSSMPLSIMRQGGKMYGCRCQCAKNHVSRVKNLCLVFKSTPGKVNMINI